MLGGFVPIVGAALIVVGVVVATNQLDARVLQPMVMGRVLSLHPLVVLLALAGGGILSGIAGAVLVVPLTAVAWALIQIWAPAPGRPVEAPGPG